MNNIGCDGKIIVKIITVIFFYKSNTTWAKIFQYLSRPVSGITIMIFLILNFSNMYWNQSLLFLLLSTNSIPGMHEKLQRNKKALSNSFTSILLFMKSPAFGCAKGSCSLVDGTNLIRILTLTIDQVKYARHYLNDDKKLVFTR